MPLPRSLQQLSSIIFLFYDIVHLAFIFYYDSINLYFLQKQTK